MGVFLSKPKTDKTTSSGHGNSISYALSHMQGWRQEMEDAHSVYVSLPDPFDAWSFFAVFDGHAGSVAANLCAEKLLEKLLSEPSFVKAAEEYSASSEGESVLEELKESIANTYIRFDDEMRVQFVDSAKSEPEKSGTTAVAVLISPKHYIFINVGDSRCVLCGEEGEIRFHSIDHKPNNVGEKLRIENAGGTVSLQRVNGQLAVSRAMGDFDYKNTLGLPTRQQQVSPEPDVSFVERLPSDQFLIIACDGIFDVISNEDLCLFTSYLLQSTESHEEICNAVINTCFHKGSRDNMSLILVTFPNAPPLDSEMVAKQTRLDSQIDSMVNEIIEQEGPKVYLDRVFKRVSESTFDFIPPGGGIHSKYALVEKIYTEKVPEQPEGSCDPSQNRRSFQDILNGLLINQQNLEESDNSK